MIVVDGREIKFSSETREQTLKTIIDAIEKDILTDDDIHKIQLTCVFRACGVKLRG